MSTIPRYLRHGPAHLTGLAVGGPWRPSPYVARMCRGAREFTGFLRRGLGPMDQGPSSVPSPGSSGWSVPTWGPARAALQLLGRCSTRDIFQEGYSAERGYPTLGSLNSWRSSLWPQWVRALRVRRSKSLGAGDLALVRYLLSWSAGGVP